MSIREAISKRPGIVAAFALLAIGAAGYFATRSDLVRPQRIEANAFFTTDDGHSTFVAPAAQLPPFDHGGRPAYRACVFTCDGGATTFVGYLQRYTPAAKQRLEQALAERESGTSHMPVSVRAGESEVKRPGQGDSWVSVNDPVGVQIVNVTGPHGEQAQPLSP